MEIRSLGRSGLKVSVVGLGSNNFGDNLDAAGAERIIHKALDLGITYFDVADYYGGPRRGDAEIFLGRALGGRRSEVVVSTKFGVPMGTSWTLRGGASRDYIIRAAEASLRRLGTDYIDLFQLHVPDPTTPIEETLRALDDLVHQGKVRYVGHANLLGWQIADGAWASKLHNLTPFVSTQNHYSVLHRDVEAEIVPACLAHGLSILPYFPLASGVLTGKYTEVGNPPPGSRLAVWASTPGLKTYAERFLTDPYITKAKQLGVVAAETGGTVLDLAFGWLLSRPYVASVMASVSKAEQLEENVKAAAWRPTPEQLKRIDEISPPPAAAHYAEVVTDDLRRRGYSAG